MLQVTRTIAGQEITLEQGNWYIATRPMATKKKMDFPVSITQSFDGNPVVTIPGLTYEQANELINAFNNGSLSFDGRVW